MITITWGEGGKWPALYYAWRSLPLTGLTDDVTFLQVGNSIEPISSGIGGANTVITSHNYDPTQHGSRAQNGYNIIIKGNLTYTVTVNHAFGVSNAYFIYVDSASLQASSVTVTDINITTVYGFALIYYQDIVVIKNIIVSETTINEWAFCMIIGQNKHAYLKNIDIDSTIVNMSYDGAVVYVWANEELTFEDSIIKYNGWTYGITFLDYSEHIDTVLHFERLYFISDDEGALVEYIEEGAYQSPMTANEYNNDIFASFEDIRVIPIHYNVAYDTSNFESLISSSDYYNVPKMNSVLTSDSTDSTNMPFVNTDILGRAINYYSVGSYTNKDSKVTYIDFDACGTEFGTELSNGSVFFANTLVASNFTSENSVERASSWGIGSSTSENSVERAYSWGFSFIDNMSYDVSSSTSVALGTEWGFAQDVTNAPIDSFGSIANYLDNVTSIENTPIGNVESFFALWTDSERFLNHVPYLGVEIDSDYSFGVGRIRTVFSAEITYI